MGGRVEEGGGRGEGESGKTDGETLAPNPRARPLLSATASLVKPPLYVETFN